MAERDTRNDLSGSDVAGHVVQVGTVHGDVVLNAAEQAARIEHARQLREDRLSSYQDFIDAVIRFVGSLNAEARHARDLVFCKSDKRLSPSGALLAVSLDQMRPALDHLAILQTRVCLHGPESASVAATSVLGAATALHLSTEAALNHDGVPQTWLLHHERFQSRMQAALKSFIDEARRVRETPPV